MGSFYGLEIARKGLFASQKAIDLIGHNIANANTKGYTRQRINFNSISPQNNNVSYQIGSGVEIGSIEQMRDIFLDGQFRNENSCLAEYSIKKETLQQIEDIFNEPSDYGISKAMSDVFSALEELSKDAGSEQVRGILRQNVITMTDTINLVSLKLHELQSEQDKNIERLTMNINSYAMQIRDLNETIFNYELSGENANDLRDKRNLLVDELSEIIGISVSESEEGHFRVAVNGEALVDHNNYNLMETKDTYYDSVTDQYFCEVYWVQGGNKVNITSGEINGRLSLRDGNQADEQGITYFIDKLDKLSRAFVNEFNNINNQGYTIPYDTNPSVNNIDFFDPLKTNSKEITLSEEILENVYNIAASSVLIADETQRGNNGNIEEFISLRDADNIVVDSELIGNFEDYYNKLINEMAITTEYNANIYESQYEMTEQIDYRRNSVSSVSVDEEMANLVRYQNTYAAAAKLMSAMDEMLQILLQM